MEMRLNQNCEDAEKRDNSHQRQREEEEAKKCDDAMEGCAVIFSIKQHNKRI